MYSSFWFDNWSERGALISVLGERGIVDMGIRREATGEEGLKRNRRRRRHSTLLLYEVEIELAVAKEKLKEEVEDKDVWRQGSGYKQSFSTAETWALMRTNEERCDWAKGIWFSQATPKFAFVAWLAARDRLSTMDRISKWDHGIDVTCVLCKREPESRNHLFFECGFSSQIWEHLTKGILISNHSNVWQDIMSIILDERLERKKRFCLRYAFQAAIHAIWRERNKIRHNETALPIATVMKLVEKGIRNKLSVLRRKQVKGWESGLQFWFSTRF